MSYLKYPAGKDKFLHFEPEDKNKPFVRGQPVAIKQINHNLYVGVPDKNYPAQGIITSFSNGKYEILIGKDLDIETDQIDITSTPVLGKSIFVDKDGKFTAAPVAAVNPEPVGTVMGISSITLELKLQGLCEKF